MATFMYMDETLPGYNYRAPRWISCICQRSVTTAARIRRGLIESQQFNCLTLLYLALASTPLIPQLQSSLVELEHHVEPILHDCV
jgi:hypothetical protein